MTYSILLNLARSRGLHIDLPLFYIILFSLTCYLSILSHDYHHLILIDDIEFDIKIIDDLLYYRIFEINKINEEYDNIRETIINEKNKLKDITFNKCVIINDVFYYKNRLWISEFMYIFTIQEIHD